MKLIPRSSLWRTILMVWLLILLSQISTLWFAVYYLYLPGVKQNARLVAFEMDTIRYLVDSERENELLERMKMQHDIEVTADPSSVPPESDNLFNRLFVDPMRSRIGLGAQVRVGLHPVPSLWVQTPSLDGLWVRFPLDSLGRYQASVFIAWLFGTPLIAFLIATIFMRNLNRPLQRLEMAARKIGRGEPIHNLAVEKTSTEIAALNKAFLRMSENLQRADRERALLLAGISHDLRTPLTRMRLSAELLGESEFTEGMIRDIEDMNAILDQFILFVRDGNDEMTEVGDLNEVLAEVISQYDPEECVIHPHLMPLPVISIKRLSIKRMFANLIGNAMQHGGGDVDVYSRIEDGEICIKVADRGPGLSEKQIFEVFQPFARGDQSRSTKGSGLGLAIVERIVTMHHGRVRLRNRMGGGLEAVVHFPITGALVPPDSMMRHVY